jgi:hypothetical protein
MRMKIAILGLPICMLIPQIVRADSKYTFCAPTERDRQIAKLAADWLFHDDWGSPCPSNAYSGRWKERVPEQRERLRTKYNSIPLDIIKLGTNTRVLLTYTVESRSLQARPSEPDPWPVPRLSILKYVDKDGRHFLRLRWAGSIEYHLLVEEQGNRVVVKQLHDLRYID